MLHRRRVAIELIVVVWRASLSRPSGDLSYPAYRARASEPPAIEMSVATPLLRASVPAEDKARTNPLGGDPADIAATIYHCLGIDPRADVSDQQGRPLVVNAGAVIGGLLGA